MHTVIEVLLNFTCFTYVQVIYIDCTSCIPIYMLLTSEVYMEVTHACIQYGAYISRVFNFANFELFAKFISAKILMVTVRYMSSTCVREIILTKFQKQQFARPAK